MNVGERMGLFTVVPSVPPGNAAANALVHAGAWVNLSKYNRASIVIRIGAAAVSTRTIRLREALNVAGAGAQALDFSHIWRTGARLYFDPTTQVGAFQVGEVITGAGAGAATIHSIHGDHFVVHTWNNTVFVANEVVTGATTGATVNLVAAGFWADTDILVRQEVLAAARAAAALNTFICPAVANKTYVVEVKAPDLSVNDGYTCINMDISAVAGADDTARSIEYILTQPRYKQEPMESAIV